jgi:hydrogenase/urease accessory protein HupE
VIRLASIAALALAALVAAAGDASAHLGNISYADFEVSGRDVALRFRYAAHVTPGLPAGQPLPAGRAAWLGLEGRIEDWIAKNSSVVSGGRPCRFGIDNLVGPDANLDLEIEGGWTCEGGDITGLRIDFHPLAEVLNDWQTIASMKLGGQSASTVFTAEASHWDVGDAVGQPVPATGGGGQAAPPSPGSESAFTRFFRLGVWHIWTGYDHLLFLLAVLLAGGGIRRLAAIVTSFTVAHSITLGAAATGLVHLPVAPVEAGIALSIVYVALEDIFELGADRRALVTFCFGLVHGFGFASVLAESALPASGILVPLLAFNLGVEAGQLAVVLAVMPPLTLLLRSTHGRRIKVGISALVALAGATWAVERIAAIVRGG